MLFGADRLLCRLETASVRSLRQTSKVWVPWVDRPSVKRRWSGRYTVVNLVWHYPKTFLPSQSLEFHQNTYKIHLFVSFTTRNGILLPKLFWPTVRKNCSSDLKHFVTSWPSASNSKTFSWSLKPIQNFWNHFRTIFSQCRSKQFW